MDGIFWGPAVFTLPGAMAAGLIVLAISVGAMILGYLADEARMGRGTTWPELPAAATGQPAPAERAEIRRAA
ncbi:MAG: hypothetical protein L0Y78_08755 [candidate division NC10 bacterium]|nr:hypothetical protein [candidate division NC10 bacterium]